MLFCRCEQLKRRKVLIVLKTSLFLEIVFRRNVSFQGKTVFYATLVVYMSLNQMEIDVEKPDEMLFHELETSKSYIHTPTEPLADTVIQIVRHGLSISIP